MLLIVAIAWIYVVLMMSLAEHSVIAGIMTFLGYCVLPLSIVLYLMATPQRRRRRQEADSGAGSSQPNGVEQSINASATSSTPQSQDAPADTSPADTHARQSGTPN